MMMTMTTAMMNLCFQEFICEKGIQFVRIDGSTLARDRQTAVESFRLSKEVKILVLFYHFLLYMDNLEHLMLILIHKFSVLYVKI